MRFRVWLCLVCSVGSLLGLVSNGLLRAAHEGTLECIVPIDLTECAWLVCAQQGVVSRCIWSWGVLGGLIHCGIIGRVQLLTATLWFIIGLVLGPNISSLPLLIFGGRLVGTILFCKYLSQRSGLSRSGGLDRLRWWCIINLGGLRCHKCGHLPRILLC